LDDNKTSGINHEKAKYLRASGDDLDILFLPAKNALRGQEKELSRVSSEKVENDRWICLRWREKSGFIDFNAFPAHIFNRGDSREELSFSWWNASQSARREPNPNSSQRETSVRVCFCNMNWFALNRADELGEKWTIGCLDRVSILGQKVWLFKEKRQLLLCENIFRDWKLL
jgi:hypothetical protein